MGEDILFNELGFGLCANVLVGLKQRRQDFVYCLHILIANAGMAVLKWLAKLPDTGGTDGFRAPGWGRNRSGFHTETEFNQAGQELPPGPLKSDCRGPQPGVEISLQDGLGV